MRFRLLVSLAVGLSLVPSARPQTAQGMWGGFLALTNEEFGEGTNVFGPNQTITISGVIPFIPACPSMAFEYPPHLIGRGEGLFDFFPTADFYVVPDDGKPLPPTMKLQDVNGTPNRIIGTTEGIFVDEPVAVTKPAGNLGPGKYRVVMNQCLTGYYDPLGGDIVLGQYPNLGFEVRIPADLPPIDMSPLKKGAALMASKLGGWDVKALGAEITIPGFCKIYGKMVDKLPEGSFLTSWAKIALDNCSDLIAHWKGIAADPPDPNYQTFAELGAIPYGAIATTSPLERAAATLANAIADQDAITQALLSSTEKFQGAQQAGDDYYTLLQLQMMNKYINLLIGPGGALIRMYASIEAFDFALGQDPVGTLPEAQDLLAFGPEMREAIGGLLGPLGDGFNDQRSGGQDTFTPTGLQAYVQVYLGNETALGLNGIPQVRAQKGLPPIVFQHPTASAGFSYEAELGSMVTFDAGKSTDPAGGDLTYAWDLNGDGNFNDGSGAQVQSSYSQPGTRLAGVKVTNSLGNTNVDYALVSVGDTNTQQMITFAQTGDLFHVRPDGSFTKLDSGLGVLSDNFQALHVDVNQDIWMLHRQYLLHFDPQGHLLSQTTAAQLGALAGIGLLKLDDFVIDGRDDIVLLAQQDLGPGTLDGTATSHLPGPDVLLRIAIDLSHASIIAPNVSRTYASLDNVNGVLTESSISAVYGCTGVADQASVALDASGNIVLSWVNGPSPGPKEVPSGWWTADPGTGAMTEVIPNGAGTNCGTVTTDLTNPPSTFQRVELLFGSLQLHVNQFGARRAPGSDGYSGFKVDALGNYVASYLGGGFVQIFNPPELSQVGFDLGLQAFPLLMPSPGAPDLETSDMIIDSAGDYLVAGRDTNNILGSGVFRVKPDGELFKISSVAGEFSAPQLLDVVPEIRAVTPKDIPAPPNLGLSNLNGTQDTCPGATTLMVTLTNNGGTATPLPVRVYFFDGSPENSGIAVASAMTAGPLAAGGSVTLSAPWEDPTPGAHEVFAMALGANLVHVSSLVCIASQAGTDPIALSPDAGTSTVGSAYTVTAQLKTIFGDGISGAPLTFAVSGANTAGDTIVTGSDGSAQFTYSGTNPGQDSIVASFSNLTSNVVTSTWQQGSDTTPPVVTAPASITVPATQAGGARGSATALLAAFLAGGVATDNSDPSPVRLSPQVAGVAVDSNTLFPIGTTTVTFRFQDASGNIGSAAATVTVALGHPRITGSTAGKGTDPAGATYVDVVLSNRGDGNARNLSISSIRLRVLSGTGTVAYDMALSPAVPIAIGNLDAGASVTKRLYLDITGAVTRLSITESGPVQDVLGTMYNYSTAEAVIP